MTGLSASGKSTIAVIVEQMLLHQKKHAYRLDGDNIRHGLNKNLGFSAEDRAENIRRSRRSRQALHRCGGNCDYQLYQPVQERS